MVSVKYTWIAWVIWIVAAFFYSYELFLRVSPQAMVPELIQAFSINAVAVSSLAAFYFYAYASMQIPVGILFDRYGIRFLLTLAAVMVAIGCFLFATTEQLYVAIVGRILIGIGSAFSFVACLKLASNWFPARQLAMVVGLTNMCGVIGAITAAVPLSILVETIGWRETFWFSGVLGILISVLIWMVVRDRPLTQKASAVPENMAHIWRGIRCVVSRGASWRVAIFGSLMVAPIIAFTELWSIPFLMTLHHLNKIDAAGLASTVFWGIAVGGPIQGWISGRLGRRKPIMAVGTVGALLSLCSVIYWSGLSPLELRVLLFLFGFFTSSMLLIFAINTENNPSYVSGVVIGFTNMVIMAGGALFQPLVGELLDLMGGGSFGEFTLSSYQWALSVLPVCQLMAFLLLGFIDETYCQQCDKS